MLTQLSIYLPSIILGIMLFFSFVVAPIVFTTLDEENARKFIRKIFPYYYLVNLILSLLSLISFYYVQQFLTDFYLVLLVAILFVISNFILMPLINYFRDNNQEKRFKYFHALSVIINFLQLFILVYILF